MPGACHHQGRASPDWRPRVVRRPWTSRDTGRSPLHVRFLCAWVSALVGRCRPRGLHRLDGGRLSDHTERSLAVISGGVVGPLKLPDEKAGALTTRPINIQFGNAVPGAVDIPDPHRLRAAHMLELRLKLAVGRLFVVSKARGKPFLKSDTLIDVEPDPTAGLTRIRRKEHVLIRIDRPTIGKEDLRLIALGGDEPCGERLPPGTPDASHGRRPEGERSQQDHETKPDTVHASPPSCPSLRHPMDPKLTGADPHAK